MSFLWMGLLWLLTLIPVLIVVYILLQKRRQKYALRYASLSLVKEALGKGPQFRRHIPPILFLIGLAILITGMARPVAIVTLPSQQGTVILTIDTSGSMAATDLKPSRIEAAKASALLFVEKQAKNVRIGVVSFAGSAFVVQAPTIDRAAVIAAINRLQTTRNTAIGSGILTSLQAIFEEPGAKPTTTPSDPLDSSADEDENTGKRPEKFAAAAIILLSDGVSNTGPPPLDIIEQAVNQGVRIYTVGVGSVEGTILKVEGMSLRVKLDEEVLGRIARETGGEYFQAGTEQDLSKIYENLGTQLVFKAEQTEITAIFVAIAGVFLLLSAALSMLWFHRIP
jgi:Ca-activated chloride channel homolog